MLRFAAVRHAGWIECENGDSHIDDHGANNGNDCKLAATCSAFDAALGNYSCTNALADGLGVDVEVECFASPCEPRGHSASDSHDSLRLVHRRNKFYAPATTAAGYTGGPLHDYCDGNFRQRRAQQNRHGHRELT